MKKSYIKKLALFVGIFLGLILLLPLLLKEDLSKKTLASNNIEEENKNKDENNARINARPSPKEEEYIYPPLHVRNQKIFLGENTENLIKKLGSPGRIDKTEYDFEYYIYNNNYNKLLFVLVSNENVVGYYTDSLDFEFMNISPSSDINDVNKQLGTSFELGELLIHDTGQYNIHILMDRLESEKVTGIYLTPNEASFEGFTSEVMRGIEIQVYDLTNSIRVRKSLPPLSWSSSAALSSRKHSQDMAKNNFFSHVNLGGRNPSDRMTSEGIPHGRTGENIIAGYGGAILSNHAWFNSPDHRNNLLSENFRYLGVGFTYDPDSIYETYITQNFYR